MTTGDGDQYISAAMERGLTADWRGIYFQDMYGRGDWHDITDADIEFSSCAGCGEFINDAWAFFRATDTYRFFCSECAVGL